MPGASKWLIPAFVFICPSIVHAQSCTSATCRAADCSRNNVLAALPSPSNTNSTVTVIIPACTAAQSNWTSHLTYAVPSGVTSLTIQGQTVCNGTGDPNANNLLACTDGTTIQDNDTADNNWLIGITSAGGFVRITGLTVQKGTGITKGSGLLAASSGTIRIDHNHINYDSDTVGAKSNGVYVGGCTRGVVDHNLWTNQNDTTGFAMSVDTGQGCLGNRR